MVVLDPPTWSAILASLRSPAQYVLAVLNNATSQEPAMRKRKASLYPSSDRPALPVLPSQGRFLVKPNC